MEWTEWDWLTALLCIALLTVVAAMSWPNNSNPNHHNPHQPTQRMQQAASTNSPNTSLAHTTTSSINRTTQPHSTQSPSMDLGLPATPATMAFASTDDEQAYIATLLQQAHASMAQQKPMRALGLVLAAVRQKRGEEGVFDVLNETREGFGLKPHANPVRQQREMLQQEQMQQMDVGMSALSLQSADRPQLPSSDDTEMADEDDDESEGEDDEYEDEGGYQDEGEASIVDEDLVDEAVRAGTHVQCRACGGVIARSRMEAHVTMWCEANDSHGDG